jgi:1-acyl-sn-glycerol-3-phosphate acyltransferase
MIEAGKEYIVVARHRSYWDIPLLAIAFGLTKRIHFIARQGLEKNMVFRPLLALFSTTINREKFSKTDLRHVLEMMKRERLVAVFPEGTTKSDVDLKAGVVHFARLTRKLILPVQLKTDGPYPPRYPFGFPKMTISIGKAVSISELEEEIGVLPAKPCNRASVLTQRLMEHVDAA